VRKVNIADPEFIHDDDDPPGFRAGMFRFGPLLEAKQMGASVYELPPGEAVCPYHYELGEEEWLLVLEGRASVRTPAGTEQLEPFDVAFFPRGPEGAHQLRNDSDSTARILMWSEVLVPAATVYPDSDKIGVWTGNKADDVIVRRSSAVDYYDGEGEDRD
jgi:uncharacterized cupin superfamily protein